MSRYKIEDILKIDNLSVGYGKNVVVRSINQRILKGQFVCLLGPNGSGKTTILRTLARLLKPLKGTAYIKGKDILECSSSNLAKTLSVVLTGHISAGLLTVFEFVAMGRYPYTGFLGRLTQEDDLKIKECLKLVNAQHLIYRYFNELSDGERQKVVFARALAQEPDLIILDEPTVHLDLKHRIELIKVLRDSCKKKRITVLVSLHDIDLALRIADMVILIKNGKIIDYGDPDEVLDGDAVSKLYDLDSVCFNSQLGTIDIIGNTKGKQKIFIIGGGGTGVPIYRYMSKKDITSITGILHENDVDFFVAKSLGAKIISEKPFSSVKESTLNRCLKHMEVCDIVIDTGFPVGEMNIQNTLVIKDAVLKGKRVFSLRRKDELFSLIGELTEEVVFLKKINSIWKRTV